MDCVIIGAGGHGRVVLDILTSAGEHKVIGFLDTSTALHGRHMDGVEVLGPIDLLPELLAMDVRGAIVAIGDNGTRRSMAKAVEEAGAELINAVHPSANIAANATVGRGIVVAPGALVCAHCQIGDLTVLNTGCIIDHETMIGTACHICPGAKLAGRVTIESGAFIGIGATIIQRVRVGHDALVGAGAVVLQDVAPMTTVVGVPATEVRDLGDPSEFAQWLMPESLKNPPG